MGVARADLRCWDCGRACPEVGAVRRTVVTGYSSGLRGRRFYNRVTLCPWCNRRHRRWEALRTTWRVARTVLLLLVVVTLVGRCQAAFDRLERSVPRPPAIKPLFP
jgi:hypothetical protein